MALGLSTHLHQWDSKEIAGNPDAPKKRTLTFFCRDATLKEENPVNGPVFISSATESKGLGWNPMRRGSEIVPPGRSASDRETGFKVRLPPGSDGQHRYLHQDAAWAASRVEPRNNFRLCTHLGAEAFSCEKDSRLSGFRGRQRPGRTQTVNRQIDRRIYRQIAGKSTDRLTGRSTDKLQTVRRTERT